MHLIKQDNHNCYIVINALHCNVNSGDLSYSEVIHKLLYERTCYNSSIKLDGCTMSTHTRQQK